MEIFEHAFMRRAFVVGIIIALIIPCIGIIAVFRRTSMIGDALSHVSLAGVAAGLVMGINPVVGALLASICASLSIEFIRKRMPHFSDISVAVTLSFGVGVAGVLSGFVSSVQNFNSFLFGSIVAITRFEVVLVCALGLAILICFFILRQEIFLISIDERSARMAGVSVGAVSFICTILTAVAVSIAARAVGALIVSSIMVVPVACAIQVAKSYRQTVGYSMGFAVCFMVAGLFLSYYIGLRPGGAVALIGVLCLVAIMIIRGGLMKGFG